MMKKKLKMTSLAASMAARGFYSSPPPPPAIQAGHKHPEAFNLMWYSCKCGHHEVFWNSRDGVTPFGTMCPSCDQPELKHAMWNLDRYAPEHQPKYGQKVWASMTLEAAEKHARKRVEAHALAYPDAGITERFEDPATLQSLIDDIYKNGEAPMLLIAGVQLIPIVSKEPARVQEKPQTT